MEDILNGHEKEKNMFLCRISLCSPDFGVKSLL